MAEATKKQVQALAALVAHGHDKEEFNAPRFADVVWPDSSGHNVRTNGPWGLAGTTGIWMSAGTQISRLCKAGFVRVSSEGYGWMRYQVTPAGVRASSGDPA